MLTIHRQEDAAAALAAEDAVLEDRRLSYAARGLLLRALRSGPQWDVNADGLSSAAKEARGDRAEGRRTMRILFGELEKVGYLRRTKRRKTTGEFYTLLEVFDAPCSGEYEGPTHGTPPYETWERVYVVGEPGSSIVKIGTTTNTASRLDALQHAHGKPLVYRWLYNGNVELEYHLHRRFRSLALGREWFDFKDSDPVASVALAVEAFYRLTPGATLPLA